MVKNRLFRVRAFALFALCAASAPLGCGPSNNAGPDASPGTGTSGSGSGSGGSPGGSGSNGGTGSSGSDGGSGGSDGGNVGTHGLFLDSITGQASVVYDSQGGLHVAGSGPSGLRYGYCASNCDQAGNWGYADVAGADAYIGADSGGYGLAVDGQGHPRVMTTWNLNGNNYFECNGNCTSSMSWSTATKIPAARPSGAHFFAVSPQGVAAYAIGNDYESCTSNCTNPSNWTKTQAATVPPSFVMSTVDGVLDGSLTFDSQGGPRMTYVLAAGNNDTVGYAACDTGCNSAAGWQNVALQSLTSASPLLAVDPSGNPRIVGGMTGAYYWCDSSCTASAQSWQGPVTSGNADWVAADAQGGIRTVHEDTASSAVNYTWCAGDCTSTSPQWQNMLLPFTDMDKVSDPTAGMPPGSQWSGLSSRIALDSTGAAAIVLNAQHFPSAATLADNPDAYGVFLWLVPAVTVSNSGSDSGSGSGGSSGSGSSGGSGSGSGGSADSGPDPLANFVGAPWSGTQVTTIVCGDAGAHPVSASVTRSFESTSSGVTFTGASGCTWTLTVSGATATLDSTPETCDVPVEAGTEVLSLSAGMLATSDGHHLTGELTGTDSLGATTCSLDLSFTLTR